MPTAAIAKSSAAAWLETPPTAEAEADPFLELARIAHEMDTDPTGYRTTGSSDQLWEQTMNHVRTVAADLRVMAPQWTAARAWLETPVDVSPQSIADRLRFVMAWDARIAELTARARAEWEAAKRENLFGGSSVWQPGTWISPSYDYHNKPALDWLKVATENLAELLRLILEAELTLQDAAAAVGVSPGGAPGGAPSGLLPPRIGEAPPAGAPTAAASTSTPWGWILLGLLAAKAASKKKDRST